MRRIWHRLLVRLGLRREISASEFFDQLARNTKREFEATTGINPYLLGK